MVVVAVCPVHGAQRSQGFNLSNSVGVTLAGNMETCSVQGCGRMARTMDGSYNFLHASTEVISAPQWSIKALREVAPKLGETIRLLASPSTTADEARKAVEDVTPQVEKAVEGLPLPLSKKIVNALELSPGESPVGWRKRVGAVLAVIFFLTLNYSSLKTNVSEMVDDAGQLAGWVSENAAEVPEWFDQVAQWLFDNDESPD